MVVYLFSSLIVILSSAIASTILFPQQPLNCLAIFISLTLFQITIITLTLGAVNLLYPSLLLIGSIALGSFILITLFLNSNKDKLLSISTTHFQKHALPNQKGWILLIAITSIFLFCFGQLIYDLCLQVTFVHPLSWDVVTYHLPSAVTYLQSLGLWKLGNTFSQYPGGNELINLWSLIPLKQDAALGLTSLVLNLGTLLVALLLLRDLKQWKYNLSLYFTFLLFLLIYLSINDTQVIFFDIGRNDVTLAFWVLTGSWAWMKSLQNKKVSFRYPWLFWSGVSFGCALGIKPNAIYYIAGIFAISIYNLITNYSPKIKRKSYLRVFYKILWTWLLPIAMISSFWYLRNLYLLGSFFEDHVVKSGLNLSISRNLFSLEIYKAPNGRLLLFSIFITLLLIILISNNQFRNTNLKQLVKINVISFIAWILTPYSAGYYAGEIIYFHPQLRHGLVYVITVIILMSYLSLTCIRIFFNQKSRNILSIIDNLFHHLHKESDHTNKINYLFISSIAAASVILLLIQVINYNPPRGLPGFSGILFYPSNYRSHVYEWVQENIKNKRILNLGLRSYGLVNFPFSNEVTDAGSPATWRLQENNLQQYDYLAVSVDPFTGKISQELAAFLQAPRGYKIVYSDQLSVVLKRIS
ncbi:hypothetical protein D3A95_04065 [Thermosynechococcus sichuanensis E542]|uniref:Uncharacterized protein n=1 Tax=Thermosynechococcus sichuanensis E542 TaxID=2016101 RepID=A0A3B7MAD8_9CYAN|nr:hypothetical protein [Thermosynechococcus vestitus]AXY67603.2 hypothetical protein D3A95_04065 [Thermosynechococcus vestitus E542]